MKTLSNNAISLFTAFAVPAPAQSNQSGELQQYLKVTDALFQDNLADAKAAAQKLVADHAKGMLAGPAGKVVAAATIEDARQAFKALSAAAIKLASGDKTYTVIHCPMIKGGGGDWLSADGKVNNPYYGSRMPHCGGPKQ